jgi:hypothetical protein
MDVISQLAVTIEGLEIDPHISPLSLEFRYNFRASVVGLIVEKSDPSTELCIVAKKKRQNSFFVPAQRKNSDIHSFSDVERGGLCEKPFPVRSQFPAEGSQFKLGSTGGLKAIPARTV